MELGSFAQPALDDDTLLRDFEQTIEACSKQLDAFHASLQAMAKAGASRGAICLPDAALGGKLVVRLSMGMEGASNKVLGASTPGAIPAFAAFADNRRIVVADYAAAPDLHPTDLEERLGITSAAYAPIHSPRKQGAAGLLIAVPAPGAAFDSLALERLDRIAAMLGERLDRLTVAKPFLPTPLPEGSAGWPEELFEAFRACLNTPNIEDLSDKTLDYCRRFTGSQFGFVGYLDPETGHLVCPTMTKDIFPQCEVAGKTVVFEKAGGLGGWVLDNKTPLIANDPFSHPASVGTPPGHLPIRKFMGIPCFSQGQVVGMIALANKDTDYDGQDLKIATAFADIYAAAVARFFSERELTASRNRFSSLYQDAPCGYHTLAPDGTILEINDTGLQMLGRGREEMAGGFNINQLLTTTGKSMLVEQIKAIKKEGRAVAVELHFKRPDGGKFPALHSATPATDEQGFLKAIRCTMVDITERKQYENAMRQLKESMEDAVQAIASTVEKRDPYTAGHQQRVARLAVAIAEELGLPPQVVEGVHFGGLIHDIGKISIPAEILSKPGKISKLEYILIQGHPASGKEILEGVQFPWPIADMVHQHHERLDGSGYPNGLKDQEILLEAKILAVADVVESMSSHRPYRPALGVEAALEEITRNSGRLYDAKVVDACVRVVREKKFRFDEPPPRRGRISGRGTAGSSLAA